MASPKLKPQNELSGTRLGDPDLGLKAKWAGSAPGPDRIAAVSKSDRRSSGANRRPGNPSPTTAAGKGGLPPDWYSGKAGWR